LLAKINDPTEFFRVAIMVAARLRLERARGAGDALALIGLPALVLDQDGAVMWANRLKSEIVGN
jgi:hypothetical protein